uniref:Retrotransposon protein, putative, unclassified n=1 Tax=Oryza sativa subsp. japonica TaxID=39947 RepID=Q2QSN4_ORYSJ|nr:retrotransposon protein, putative, unclassified [Oryza sativa Japonica Group]
MAEYLHEFNRLARYAPEDVRTDEERQEKFFEGLKDELSVTLISHDYVDFQQPVDKAIRLEDKKNRMDNRKRKMTVFQEAQVCVPRLIPGRGFYAQISLEITCEFLGVTCGHGEMPEEAKTRERRKGIPFYSGGEQAGHGRSGEQRRDWQPAAMEGGHEWRGRSGCNDARLMREIRGIEEEGKGINSPKSILESNA